MKIEPILSWPAPPPLDANAASRALVPVPVRHFPLSVADVFDAPAAGPITVRERVGAVDARHISPRQIAEISMDLYVGGALSWEEYALLAFQPELHPDYERTIGALTGASRTQSTARLYRSVAEAFGL